MVRCNLPLYQNDTSNGANIAKDTHEGPMKRSRVVAPTALVVAIIAVGVVDNELATQLIIKLSNLSRKMQLISLL